MENITKHHPLPSIASDNKTFFSIYHISWDFYSVTHPWTVWQHPRARSQEDQVWVGWFALCPATCSNMAMLALPSHAPKGQPARKAFSPSPAALSHSWASLLWKLCQEFTSARMQAYPSPAFLGEPCSQNLFALYWSKRADNWPGFLGAKKN